MIRSPLPAVRALALGALVLAAASSAGAQERGAVEIGASARWTTFDNSLRLAEHWGIAGHAGFFFMRNLSLEGQVAQVDTRVARQGGEDVQHRTSYVRLVSHYPLLPSTRLLMGLGYSFASYKDLTGEGDHGATALVGVRQSLTRRVSLRVDGAADYYPSPANETELVKRNWNYSVQAGLALLWGRLEPAAPPPPPDGDGDGVVDANDRCAGTPMGDRVDATGCSLPKDGDNDGVTDANDRCPNTAAGTTVDATGCEPPKDADNDGVVDANDRCPATPAGRTVDATGCEPPPPAPPADSDNDGIADTADRCPGTTAGTRVDAAGCAVLFTDTARTLTLQGVNFETGKAVLTAESQVILDNVAASLVANADVRVEVAGHTDNTGSAATNTRLSAARAAAVRAYLVAKGVAADRLTARGYGPSQPVAPNTTVDGRAQNRRVELKRID